MPYYKKTHMNKHYFILFSILILTFKINFGQEIKYYIISNNDTISVDTINQKIDNGIIYEIETFVINKKRTLKPSEISGFIIEVENYNKDKYYFESILNFEQVDTQFVEGVFLNRKMDGEYPVYIFYHNEKISFCTIEKNKLFVFDIDDYIEKSKLFFYDKPSIYSNLLNTIEKDEYEFDTILDFMTYLNKPPKGLSKADGYNDLQLLCKDFINSINSGNKEQLCEFLDKILVDSLTNEFFKRYSINYRNIPTSCKIISETRKRYISEALFLQNSLKKIESKDSIQFKIVENIKTEVFDPRYNIEIADVYIMTNIGNGLLKLGEMLKVNGNWIVFTLPKF